MAQVAKEAEEELALKKRKLCVRSRHFYWLCLEGTKRNGWPFEQGGGRR